MSRRVRALIALAALGCSPVVTPPIVVEERERPAWRSLDEIEHGFLASCSSRVPGEPDHCACAWEQARRTFDEREMNAWGEDPLKLAWLRESIARHCVIRRADAAARAAFVQRCAGDDARFVPYCECIYADLRRTLVPGEIDEASRRRSERFVTARADAGSRCALTMEP